MHQEDIEDTDKLDFAALIKQLPSEVQKASCELVKELVWTESTEEQIREVFFIANQWRELHEFPMRRIRHQLLGHMSGQRVRGLTAARLKRMPSIRKKLRKRKKLSLETLQDLGGCRIILPSMKDLRKFVDHYKSNHGHRQAYENDYIDAPKRDGYRSHHLILEFCPKRADEETFRGLRVEVQIRTRLQHAWATAVEAVGMFRQEDFKSGSGDKDWRKLFELVSSEFAYIENCPVLASSPNRTKRLDQIKDLDRKLNASANLSQMSLAFRYLDTYLQPVEKPSHWQITYDAKHRTVKIEGFNDLKKGTKSYQEAESKTEMSEDHLNTVLVEVDKMEKLREAFPNYFGDVQLFSKNLTRIVKGRLVTEYTLPPQQVLSARPKQWADDGWLRNPHRRRWT